MGSPFEMLARTSRALVERVHGEMVRISFMDGSMLDAARGQAVVRAIISMAEPDLVQFRTPSKSQMRTEIAGCNAMLFLDLATYDGPQPRVGDKIRALDRPGQPVWEMADVPRGDGGLIRIPLMEVGS